MTKVKNAKVKAKKKSWPIFSQNTKDNPSTAKIVRLKHGKKILRLRRGKKKFDLDAVEWARLFALNEKINHKLKIECFNL